MKLRITGNSHVGCLKHGLEALPLYGEHEIEISGFIHGKDQRATFHATDRWSIVLTRGQRLDRFIKVMGSAAIDRDATWGVCMLPHSEYLYTQPDEPVNFDRDSKSVFTFVTDLKKAKIKHFAIMTPGPNRTNREIPEGCISHAGQVDRDYREYLRDRFDRGGIDWVEALPEAHDEKGFLKPQFAKKPTHDHASTTYGAMMMQRILNHIGA